MAEPRWRRNDMPPMNLNPAVIGRLIYSVLHNTQPSGIHREVLETAALSLEECHRVIRDLTTIATGCRKHPTFRGSRLGSNDRCPTCQRIHAAAKRLEESPLPSGALRQGWAAGTSAETTLAASPIPVKKED